MAAQPALAPKPLSVLLVSQKEEDYSLKQISFKIRHALNGPTPAGSQYCL